MAMGELIGMHLAISRLPLSVRTTLPHVSSGLQLMDPLPGEFFWYYSDKNFDHGSFSVSFDAAPGTTSNSYSQDITPSLLLYNESLDPGPHTVRITNLEQKVAAIDYIACASLSKAHRRHR